MKKEDKKWLLLDRDGVINEDSSHFVRTPEELIPISGSLEAIARLNQTGFSIAVITNQSGIGRGYYTEETLKQIHEKLDNLLKPLGGKIEKYYYCPHTDEDNCHCRKPKPGLIHQFAKENHIDLAKETIPFIGDDLRDLQAAQTASCVPVLVQTGKGQKTLNHALFREQYGCVVVVKNLLAFALDNPLNYPLQ